MSSFRAPEVSEFIEAFSDGTILKIIETSNDMRKFNAQSSDGAVRTFRMLDRGKFWAFTYNVAPAPAKDFARNAPLHQCDEIESTITAYNQITKERHMELKLFNTTVLSLPKTGEDTKIVVAPAWILAKSDENAKLKTAAELPDGVNLDEVVILVRSF